ncbi:hypothetical protein K8S19_06040 [bacterium]|nr:hypothetical protein [bacterium]
MGNRRAASFEIYENFPKTKARVAAADKRIRAQIFKQSQQDHSEKNEKNVLMKNRRN